VLQADWDPTFSEASFGFRPKHSAHQAVERAQAYIASGHTVVVDRAGSGNLHSAISGVSA
jgi:RNA-directed DNA polymerase